MKKTKLLSIIALLIFSLAIFTGCGNDNMPNNTGMQNGNNNMQPNNMPDNANDAARSVMPDNATSSTTTNTNGNYDKARSEKISQAIIKEIPQCNDAIVVTLGDIAYVAVDIPANSSTTEASDLKNRILSVVEDTDPAITNVYISEDADTFTRIQSALGNLADGDITQTFDEFQNMFTRIAPAT